MDQGERTLDTTFGSRVTVQLCHIYQAIQLRASFTQPFLAALTSLVTLAAVPRLLASQGTTFGPPATGVGVWGFEMGHTGKGGSVRKKKPSRGREGRGSKDRTGPRGREKARGLLEEARSSLLTVR